MPLLVQRKTVLVVEACGMCAGPRYFTPGIYSGD
jgi:hypothetical protein